MTAVVVLFVLVGVVEAGPGHFSYGVIGAEADAAYLEARATTAYYAWLSAGEPEGQVPLIRLATNTELAAFNAARKAKRDRVVSRQAARRGLN